MNLVVIVTFFLKLNMRALSDCVKVNLGWDVKRFH